MKNLKSINLIGNTPLVRVNINKSKIKALAKLETYNLTGSVKDRMAFYVLTSEELGPVGAIKKRDQLALEIKSAWIDKIISVSTQEAINETKSIARSQGLLVGVSSGANLAAAKKLLINKSVTILTIFADRGERYLSVL